MYGVKEYMGKRCFLTVRYERIEMINSAPWGEIIILIFINITYRVVQELISKHVSKSRIIVIFSLICKRKCVKSIMEVSVQEQLNFNQTGK